MQLKITRQALEESDPAALIGMINKHFADHFGKLKEDQDDALIIRCASRPWACDESPETSD